LYADRAAVFPAYTRFGTFARNDVWMLTDGDHAAYFEVGQRAHPQGERSIGTRPLMTMPEANVHFFAEYSMVATRSPAQL
jgi:hypothetical protein